MNNEKRSKALFTSSREKRLWAFALAVWGAIFLTLMIGRPLAEQLRNQNVQAVFFVCGMVLVTAAVITHGLRIKAGKVEWSILLGIAAVYVMLIFRLGAPERSHLIEYSVLAIFIFSALMERKEQGRAIRFPALYAIIIAFLIGVLDETFQLALENRVFDLQDIFFNGMAVLLAIGSSSLLIWAKKRFNSSRS